MVLPFLPLCLCSLKAAVAQPPVNVHIFCHKNNLPYCDFSFNGTDLGCPIEEMNY